MQGPLVSVYQNLRQPLFVTLRVMQQNKDMLIERSCGFPVNIKSCKTKVKNGILVKSKVGENRKNFEGQFQCRNPVIAKKFDGLDQPKLSHKTACRNNLIQIGIKISFQMNLYFYDFSAKKGTQQQGRRSHWGSCPLCPAGAGQCGGSIVPHQYLNAKSKCGDVIYQTIS